MDAKSKDMFIEWLKSKLKDERRELETVHSSLLEDLKVKLEGWAPLPEPGGGNGQSQVVIPVGKAVTLQVEGNGTALPSSSEAEQNLCALKDAELPQQDYGAKGPNSQPAHTSDGHAPLHNHPGRLPSHVETVEAHNIFQRVVLNKHFDWVFGFIIVIHVLFMSFESQYIGFGVGYDLGFPDYREPKERVWPGGKVLFSISDYFFGTMYTIELILKILALRLKFLDAWNFLDLLIVSLWYLDKFTANVELPIDTMLLRLLRLAKLLRLVKVFRSLAGFEQLFLMLTALKGSLHILVWVCVLLSTCTIAFALLMNQILVSNVLKDEGVSMETKHKAFRYFGTFSRSLFSMFEMTLANFIPIGRFLLDDVSETMGMSSIIYKLTMGFTMIAVINGCFIKETFKLAEQDDLLMIIQKDKDRKIHMEKMMKLLDMADTKGDGTLTRQEFLDVCLDPEVDKWLGAQGLRVTDAGSIYDLIDPGEGLIHKQELVMGARKLQGNARSLDVAKNHFIVAQNHIRLEQLMKMMHDKFDESVRDIDRDTKVIADTVSTISRSGSRPALETDPAPFEEASTAMPSTPAAAGTQDVADLKEELARVVKEIKDVKSILSSSCSPQPPVVNVPRAANVQVLEGSKTKVLWGCS